MENEIWLPIVGYEGIYEISNLGRIKALHKVLKMKNGRNRTHKESILTPWKTPYGYLCITLVSESVHKKRTIHSLVAQEFLKHTTTKGIDIDHIDGNPSNNKLSNLQLLSHRDNTAKGYANKKYSNNVGITYSKISNNNKRNKRWIATINIDKKQKHIGLFDTEIEAINAYNKYKDLHLN